MSSMGGQPSDLGDLCGPQRGRIWHVGILLYRVISVNQGACLQHCNRQRRYWQPFHDLVDSGKLLFGGIDAKPWP